MAAAHGSGVQFPGDDEIKTGLDFSLLDHVLACLHGAEFAITAEDVPVFVTERFKDAAARKFRGGKVVAHNQEIRWF